MRFLQTEWHRHERDRNAWEIERAEMKSRIARLEGEARTAKRLHDSLGKHVKILEIALTKEREKIKGLTKGEKVDLQRNPRDVAREELKSMGKGSSSYNILLLMTDLYPEAHLKGVRLLDPDIVDDDPLYQGLRQDAEREKSKTYLAKCSAEITYHVMPAAHPPPELTEQDLSNHVFPNQQPSQPPLQDAYVHQPQPQQPPQKQQHRNNMSSVRESSVGTQQPLLPSFNENPVLARSNTQMNHAAIPIRDSAERRAQEQAPTPLTAIDPRKPLFEQQPPVEEPVESVAQSYDAHGKHIPPSDEHEGSGAPEESRSELSDGWNFDDESSTQVDPHPQSEVPLSHRPDTDAFPSANLAASKSPPRMGSHRRKSSGAARRRSEGNNETRELSTGQKGDATTFKVRFALRGHLDVVRSVIFTGGGSPSEPEICTAGDDGSIKRWIIPASYGNYGPHSAAAGNDLDITSYFTHRGHGGAVTALAACPASPNFSNGGRASGDGWIFSGGQDSSVKVWERGRVDPKATLDGHTDAVWALCVLPGSSGSTLGDRSSSFGGPERILLVSGSADGTILIWAVSAPPQLSSPHSGSNRGTRSSRRANSVSAGSNFPSSPQPSTATSTPFHYTLVHHILRADSPSPTCISPLPSLGDNFVVSYTDASILVFDTRSGEEIVGMASLETYDGTPSTGVNSVVASTIGFDGTLGLDPSRGLSEEDSVVHGATGSRGGVEGVIISGYEDRYIRFFDANSGTSTRCHSIA
jgi:striatin 1/3/4